MTCCSFFWGDFTPNKFSKCLLWLWFKKCSQMEMLGTENFNFFTCHTHIIAEHSNSVHTHTHTYHLVGRGRERWLNNRHKSWSNNSCSTFCFLRWNFALKVTQSQLNRCAMSSSLNWFFSLVKWSLLNLIKVIKLEKDELICLLLLQERLNSAGYSWIVQ